MPEEDILPKKNLPSNYPWIFPLSIHFSRFQGTAYNSWTTRGSKTGSSYFDCSCSKISRGRKKSSRKPKEKAMSKYFSLSRHSTGRNYFSETQTNFNGRRDSEKDFTWLD